MSDKKLTELTETLANTKKPSEVLKLRKATRLAYEAAQDNDKPALLSQLQLVDADLVRRGLRKEKKVTE